MDTVIEEKIKTFDCDMEIHHTTDYDKFNQLKGNRNVTDRRVVKVIKSVRKIGYFPNPIQVNEYGDIIDGQARYTAFKSLKLPIYYIVVKGAGTKECRALNQYQTNWGLQDYIRSWAEEGMGDYVKLVNILTEYPFLQLRVLLGMATDAKSLGAGTMLGQSIMDGTFHFSADYEEIKQEAQWLEQFMKYVDAKQIHGRKETFFGALNFAYKCKYCNNDKLVGNMKNYYQKLRPFTNLDECLDSLSEVYNFQSRGKRLNLRYEYENFE